MTNALLIGGIAAISLLAALLSRWAGLIAIVFATVAMAPIWALSGGNIIVPAAMVLPAVIGFAIGRVAKHTLGRA